MSDLLLTEKIRSVIRSIPALQQFQFHEFDYFYDDDEHILHVIFDFEQKADDSTFVEDIGDADGNVLVHTANGIIVGFSILDTELGKSSQA